jgi:hypothetical protein
MLANSDACGVAVLASHMPTKHFYIQMTIIRRILGTKVELLEVTIGPWDAANLSIPLADFSP